MANCHFYPVPRSIVCDRSDIVSQISMASCRPSLSGTEEEGEEVDSRCAAAACRATAAVTPCVAATTELKSVWHFEKIERRGGPDKASQSWYCGWCGLSLRGWNATKALNHVSKALGNNDVKACSGPIPKHTLALFKAFRYKKMGAASVKRQHQDALSDSVSASQTFRLSGASSTTFKQNEGQVILGLGSGIRRRSKKAIATCGTSCTAFHSQRCLVRWHVVFVQSRWVVARQRETGVL